MRRRRLLPRDGRRVAAWWQNFYNSRKKISCVPPLCSTDFFYFRLEKFSYISKKRQTSRLEEVSQHISPSPAAFPNYDTNNAILPFAQPNYNTRTINMSDGAIKQKLFNSKINYKKNNFPNYFAKTITKWNLNYFWNTFLRQTFFFHSENSAN